MNKLLVNMILQNQDETLLGYVGSWVRGLKSQTTLPIEARRLVLVHFSDIFFL